MKVTSRRHLLLTIPFDKCAGLLYNLGQKIPYLFHA